MRDKSTHINVLESKTLIYLKGQPPQNNLSLSFKVKKSSLLSIKGRELGGGGGVGISSNF